jgi:predicted amidohydrolase
MICRDKSHPEIARILALEGAQLLLNPHCTPGNSFAGWSLRLCTARAQENGCYLIANNPIFDCPIDPAEQDGNLFAIDPYGELLCATEGERTVEQFEIIEVDTQVVQQRREKEGVDFNLYSRLPEHYGRLVRTDPPR